MILLLHNNNDNISPPINTQEAQKPMRADMALEQTNREVPFRCHRALFSKRTNLVILFIIMRAYKTTCSISSPSPPRPPPLTTIQQAATTTQPPTWYHQALNSTGATRNSNFSHSNNDQVEDGFKSPFELSKLDWLHSSRLLIQNTKRLFATHLGLASDDNVNFDYLYRLIFDEDFSHESGGGEHRQQRAAVQLPEVLQRERTNPSETPPHPLPGNPSGPTIERFKRQLPQDDELFHNVRNGRLGHRMRDEPPISRSKMRRIIKSVNPLLNVTHMEMLANENPKNQDVLYSNSQPEVESKIRSTTPRPRKSKPKSSFNGKYRSIQNPEPEQDLDNYGQNNFSLASSNSVTPQAAAFRVAENTETPSYSTDVGQIEPSRNHHHQMDPLDDGDFQVDLTQDIYNNPVAEEGSYLEAPKRLKSTRRRAANLVVANEIDQLKPNPSSQTTSSPHSSAQKHDAKQQYTTINSDAEDLTGQQDQSEVAPKVGDPQVLDHGGPAKNDHFLDWIKDPRQVDELIKYYKNEASKQRSNLASNYQPSHQHHSGELSSSQMDQINSEDLRPLPPGNLRSSAPYAATNPTSPPGEYLNQLQPPVPKHHGDVPQRQYHERQPSESTMNYEKAYNPPQITYSPLAPPDSVYRTSFKSGKIPLDLGQIEDNFYESSKRIPLTRKVTIKEPHATSAPRIKAASSNQYAHTASPLNQLWSQRHTSYAPNPYPSRTDSLQDSQADQYGLAQPQASHASQSQILGYVRAANAAPPPQPVPSSQLLRRTLPFLATADGYSGLSPFRTAAHLLPATFASLPYPLAGSRYVRTMPAVPLRHSSKSRIGRVAASGYDEGGGQSVPAPTSASTDPMWSDSQNEDDYQAAPQTIQITAVPNGVGGLGLNGLNGFNGVNGFNGLGPWNGWNGRQVLLVNRQPSVTSEWRNWILPVAAVLALPVLLGSLLVPVFLKSVMFLIQILQMLGFLLPPAAQLAGHLSAHNNSVG